MAESRAAAALPPVSGHALMRDLVETSALAAIIGAITGIIAVGVRIAIAFVTGVAFRGRVEAAFDSPQDNQLGAWVIVVPAVGALIAFAIVYVLARDRKIRGSGEIVRSVAKQRGRVSPTSVAGHAAATVVSVGSGGSAGREGAMVQLAAAVGVVASRVTGASVRRRKLLIAAGGGAAIAATFNTPIAGVIFAMEVILVEWTTRAFVPLVVASAMGTLVATHYLGDQPAFPIPTYTLVSSKELILYAVLGLLAGLLAIALSHVTRWSERFFSWIPGPEWGRHIAGGLLVGAIGFLAPPVFGVGYETVQAALQGSVTVKLLAIWLVAKLFAYAITRGSSGSSGAFSPSFFLGSTMGGAFGALCALAFPGQTGGVGAYALVGMACVYAAITRASLTVVVLLYEMTHSFSIVIPVMIAVVVGDALSKSYGAPAYFRAKSGERELQADATVNILDIVTVGEIMSTPVETVPSDEPVRRVVEQRFRTGHQGYPVIDKLGNLVGIITSTDLRKKVSDVELDEPTRRFMTPDPSTVTSGTTAHEALTEMVRLDVGHLPVVDEKEPRKLVGFVTRSDLIRVEARLHEEERETEATLGPARLKRFFRAGPK